MGVSIRKSVLIAVCCFVSAFLIGVTVSVFANAQNLESLYEKEEAEMNVNEEYGNASCDHACLIISGFIGCAGMANAGISLFFVIYGCNQSEKAKQMIMVLRRRADRVDSIKNRYRKGTRIRMKRMDDPDPVEYGCKGTVTETDDNGIVHVIWDNNEVMPVIPGVDSIEIISAHEKLKERSDNNRY